MAAALRFTERVFCGAARSDRNFGSKADFGARPIGNEVTALGDRPRRQGVLDGDAAGCRHSSALRSTRANSAAVTGTTEIRTLRTSAISASLGLALDRRVSVTGWLSARTGATSTADQSCSGAVGRDRPP